MSEPECTHEEVDQIPSPYGPLEVCHDCGHDISADGPMNDDWIARAYEAMS